MAVTLTDRRTTIDNAQTTTGWTGAGFGTTTSDVAENTAVAASLNTATDEVYFTNGAGINLSNTLVYIWLFNNAIQLSWTTGATSLLLGDAADLIAFHIAGGDRFAFRHLEGPVNWNSCVLDGSQASTKNTNGETTVVAGSFAALDLTNITRFGGHFITQSKALGGGYNVAVDIIRYGNDGIRITAGGSGTEGKFSEIAAADRVITVGGGHGVLRELQPIAFGCQAPLTFGNSGAATTCYFEDSGISLIYEDWDIGNDKYYFAVEGNAGATNYFVLKDSTISSAGPFITGTFNGGNINTLTFDGIVFLDWGNAITFSNNADASGHTVQNCTFNGCGQIDPGDVTFEDNSIQNSTAGATGALLIDADGTVNIQNISFISPGTGHAIYIPSGATGTYSLTNFTYTGYGSDGTTDAVVYNNSGGSVTLNIVGGSTPTVRNGTGASTTINNAVTVKIENVVEGSSIIVDATETAGTITAGDRILEALADISGEASTSFSYESAFEPSGLDVVCRVRNQGFPNSAIADDGGVFTNQTPAANSSTGSDITLLPASPAVNDAYYFGHNEQFSRLSLELSQLGVGTWTITWEYWNGAWTALSGISDGTNGFTSSGIVLWTLPGDWIDTTINGQGPYKYIRARVSAFTSITTQPLGRWCKLDVTRYLPFQQNRIITSTGLIINVNQVEDIISTF